MRRIICECCGYLIHDAPRDARNDYQAMGTCAQCERALDRIEKECRRPTNRYPAPVELHFDELTTVDEFYYFHLGNKRRSARC